jgi:hypothetical protein
LNCERFLLIDRFMVLGNEEMSPDTQRKIGIIILVRSLHTLMAAFLITCIVYLYYCKITDCIGLKAYMAAAFLLGEGLIVLVNNRECPLSALQRKYGDNKGFFNLFLPHTVIPYVYPSLAVVASVGILLLMV